MNVPVFRTLLGICAAAVLAGCAAEGSQPSLLNAASSRLDAVGNAVSFVSAVEATKPIAYYRLQALHGPSEVGTTTYASSGGVAIKMPGAPIDMPGNSCAVLNGTTGYFNTTQTGGISTAGSIMAWVKLAELPSKAGHFFYVAGESQEGNDFDLQFETDNGLKFYTLCCTSPALTYYPKPNTLDKWHLVVVTAVLDSNGGKRAMYWDGKLVASDTAGGYPNKVSAFTIGESLVFTGRFFSGSLEEVALWDRALTGSAVHTIWKAAH